SSLSSGEYLPGSLQGKISSDGCLKKEQMVVSAIASTPQIECMQINAYTIGVVYFDALFQGWDV
ncbi:hypothetical protein, partial [Escherichia coli]|uniref:hypothetical protein n=1 Tax=Escherichia coli TaxID=562 RepID=UPI001BB2B2E1